MNKVLFLVLLLSCVPAISNAAIDESQYVKIGGIDQWLQIRGSNEENPVLFWLNGGPGSSTIPDAFAFESWQQHFTIVMWDQRGEGKTFEKHGVALAASMSIKRMSDDGVEVAEYLHNRLPKAKLVLLGHSWGSILGVHMIRKRPDLFAAYVGTGQVTALAHQFEVAYPLLIKRAAELGKEDARQELVAIGQPSPTNEAAYEVVNKWGAMIEPPFQPSSTPLKRPPANIQRPAYLAEGESFSHQILDPLFTNTDLPALGTNFSVPVFFFQGDNDFITTTAAVREYYEQIIAPAKGFVVLENSGHSAIFRARDKFLAALLKEVVPLLQ